MPDLLDDLGNGHVRAEIVADHRNRDAMGVEPARHVAEHRRLERAPVSAMDEQRQRRRHVGPWREQIDELARALPVAQPELGAPLLHRLVAIVLGIAHPFGEDFRVLGHAGAVVVLDLVIDRHASSPQVASHHRLPDEGREGPEPATHCVLSNRRYVWRHEGRRPIYPQHLARGRRLVGRRDRPDQAAASLRHRPAGDARGCRARDRIDAGARRAADRRDRGLWSLSGVARRRFG